MKTATSLTLVAVGAIMAFAITAHPSFLNLQVTGWVLILTGVAGAVITRSTWLRRTLLVKRHPDAAAADGTGRVPQASRRRAPGRQSGVAPDAAQAEPEIAEEYVSA